MFSMKIDKIDDDEARRARNRYWAFLRTVKREFDSFNGYTETSFTDYVLTLYGIKCIMENGNFIDTYTVEDEEKYFLAKLKGLL